MELQEYLRFRHLVRNLSSDELRLEPIQRLIEQLQHTWPKPQDHWLWASNAKKISAVIWWNGLCAAAKYSDHGITDFQPCKPQIHQNCATI